MRSSSAPVYPASLKPWSRFARPVSERQKVPAPVWLNRGTSEMLKFVAFAPSARLMAVRADGCEPLIRVLPEVGGQTVPFRGGVVSYSFGSVWMGGRGMEEGME